MKKHIILLLNAFLSFSIFAQINVAEAKLGKTLEKNKDANAVFVSEIDLASMVVSGMDMTNIDERIAYTKKNNTDVKLEAERSIALKTLRDQMSKDAAAKASEVRNLKSEKQGVLGQINIIESKKKALVEIRQNVEHRSQELYDQLIQDRKNEESRIRDKNYTTVELGSDGLPTEQAKTRRENQVKKSYEDLTNKFFEDCEAVKQSSMPQQQSLLQEIRADQKALGNIRTVNSMGDELKVNFGRYEGSHNGWNAYLSLYSDGVLLYTENFIVNYDALSGKKVPDITKLDNAGMEEYSNNVDMYSSLLTRGEPIIYFEIDYNVTAEPDDNPSQYTFNFNKIRVINTVSGKITQTSNLNKEQSRTMKPEQDLRIVEGVADEVKSSLKILKKCFDKGMTLQESLSWCDSFIGFFNEKKFALIEYGNKKLYVLKTEVIQGQYKFVMGTNPSCIKYGDLYPVETVSWYDAIYFCNKLSKLCELEPVYSVDGKTDVNKWCYVPNNEKSIDGVISQNSNANGFRLPTIKEWQYAADGGENYTYSGSNYLYYVGWYRKNSQGFTNQVGLKKANGYGVFDMSGNVAEWCWDFCGLRGNDSRYLCGGSWYDNDYYCEVYRLNSNCAAGGYGSTGFRIVRNAD